MRRKPRTVLPKLKVVFEGSKGDAQDNYLSLCEELGIHIFKSKGNRGTVLSTARNADVGKASVVDWPKIFRGK